MLVLTSHGYKRVSTLVETPWLARVNNKNYRATGFWQTGIKPVFKISLANGTTLEVTADHKLQLIDGTWERAASTLGKKLKTNAVTLAVTDPGSGEFKRGWLIGSVKGDGYHTTTSKTAVCYWGESKQVLASYACSNLGREVPSVQESVDKITIKLGSKTADISTYLELDTKRILDSIYEQSPEFIAGFISGLFDADGSVQGTEQKGYSIRLAQSDLSALETVKNLLHI
jgi:intein/homing endonuclease